MNENQALEVTLKKSISYLLESGSNTKLLVALSLNYEMYLFLFRSPKTTIKISVKE